MSVADHPTVLAASVASAVLSSRRLALHCISQVLEYFAEDLFSVLGDQRPDYRWLIIGPEKAGSSFHKVIGWYNDVQP
jgi:hypothetical protein